MAIKSGLKIKNIFNHSKEFEQGTGKERKGANTFIVSHDGTGDFDDIQEAIDALTTKGGNIFIKEGTYILKNKLSIKLSNVKIEGTGSGTIIYQEGDILEIGDGSETYENIIIQNLSFLGKTMATGTGIIINDKITNLVIDNCKFSEIWGNFIEGDGSSIIKLKISNNFFTLGIFGTVNLTSVTNFQITNNLIKAATGMTFTSCNDGIIANNNLDQGGQIRINECVRCIVNNNNLDDCSTNSIWIDDSDNCIIEGNIVYKGNYAGIRATDTAEHNIISNNQVIDTEAAGGTSYGILLDVNTFSNIVLGNICTGSTTGQIQDNGTNTLANNIVT